jgi:hypothetical protein
MIPVGSQIVAGCRQTPGFIMQPNKTDPGGVAQPLPCATPSGSAGIGGMPNPRVRDPGLRYSTPPGSWDRILDGKSEHHRDRNRGRNPNRYCCLAMHPSRAGKRKPITIRITITMCAPALVHAGGAYRSCPTRCWMHSQASSRGNRSS